MARTPVAITPKISTEDRKRQRQYEVDEAMRTLARAEQIKRDETLMSDVRTLAADLKRVAGREPAAKKK